MPTVTLPNEMPADVRAAIYGDERRASRQSSSSSLLTLAFGLVIGLCFLVGGAVLFLLASSREAVLAGAALVILGTGVAVVTIVAVAAQVGREALNQKLATMRVYGEAFESAENENAALDALAATLGALATAVGATGVLAVWRQVLEARVRSVRAFVEQRETVRGLIYENREPDSATIERLIRAVGSDTDKSSSK